MTWRIHIASGIPFGRLEETMMIFRDDGYGRFSYISGPLVMKSVDSGAAIPEADVTMRFGGFGGAELDDFLRAFVEAAWERGIRPKALSDQRGELAATREHLADFKRLVFGAYPGAAAEKKDG